MKTRFIYFVICLILVNCKEPQPKLIFNYSDKPMVLNCNNEYTNLLNEALHNFEATLTEHYGNNKTNISSINNAYRDFLKESTINATNYNNIANQHSLDIFEALKNIDGLWITKNNQLSLNYKHEIFSCIGNNISDKDLKTTFNALLSTNSMSIRMLKDLFLTRSHIFNKDKYLATYVALELYYSKLSNVDLTKKEEKPLDTTKDTKDPHAGHNHD
ncbi:hypothetical protein [Psychroserpens ponticola]|uniref:Uncharacterized protein n=1 Tax=Psychroserpens ponticola TaxID=2932268 RepID=A0ABY7S0T5_9FLAO|nr:hypothetical protein [Psychroserpens ponticola]WCO02585.1 hypothetical protein MUN68_003595 [Psychroserpens ponticola]